LNQLKEEVDRCCPYHLPKVAAIQDST